MRRGRAAHLFSRVPSVHIQRSLLTRSHTHKTTFDAGMLIPVYVDEILPGDTFDVSVSSLIRFATLIFPIMDNVYIDFQAWFVPNRLVWNNWERFNGQQDNPGDSTDYTTPQIKSGDAGWAECELFDYMGLPTKIANLSSLTFYSRAYNLIWNEWYRDENLQDSAVVDKGDGPDDIANYKLLPRGKRHDYFTSCLPWPQKGEGVDLPLGTTAPVTIQPDGSFVFKQGDAGLQSNVYLSGDKSYFSQWNGDGATAQMYSSGLKGIADLSQATAATISSLRTAFQIQRLKERDARGGTRYTEMIRAHFGVVSPDARLQRPEYLGGFTIPMVINPVVQTSATQADVSPQANLAAYGVSGNTSHLFKKGFTEHGVLVVLCSARADLNYQQGMNRMWSRKTRFDYYYPVLAHLSEQGVLQKEIRATGTEEDDEIFGYQEAWAEYRYYPSLITGKFRSNATGTLDAWHLAQNFTNKPVLNGEFIKEQPPIDRVVAVPDEPHFLADFFFKVKAYRPLPVYSVPGMVDHF